MVVQVLGHEKGVALVEGLSDCAPVGALVLFSNGAKGCAPRIVFPNTALRAARMVHDLALLWIRCNSEEGYG